MPWGRIDDRLAMSAKIRGLIDPGATGERAKQQRCESLGAWVQILSWVSGERTDGWFTQDVADLFGRPQAVARLLRSRYGRAPLVHRREDGEQCECLNGRTWPDDYDYLIHDFLTKNPSRTENDREKAKRANRRDSRLKQLVYDRDGGCCRYCRTGPISPKAGKSVDRRKALQFDHVDPDRAAGPNGEDYVTGCARCNRLKGDRTPEEADMVLLPEPTAEQRAALRARELQVYDLPATIADDPMLALESATKSATDQEQITDPVTDRITDTASDPDPDLNRTRMAETRPEKAEQQPRSAANAPPRGTGSGRGGHRSDPDLTGTSPPAQPPRSATAPDIYHRRSRGPATEPPPHIYAEPGPFDWPAGSVPVPTEPLQHAVQHPGGTA